jgi:hypothetical protein
MSVKRATTTMSKSGESSPDKHWWTASIPNRSVAAYQVGRLLNQLHWHMSLAAVFASRRTHQIVNRVLGYIASTSYELIDTPPNDLEVHVRAVQVSWQDELHCESLAEDLWVSSAGCNESIEEIRDERLSGIVRSYVNPLTDPLHKAFKNALRSSEIWAFELGECLDQGVHPPDVWRFLYQPEPIPDDLIDAPSGGETDDESDDHIEVKRGGIENTGYRPLVNHLPQPGELPPPNGWSYKLPKLCEKAGIAGTLKQDMFLLSHGTTRDDAKVAISAAIVQADHAVREALSQSTFSVSGDNESRLDRARTASDTVSLAENNCESESLVGICDESGKVEPIDPGEYARLKRLRDKFDKHELGRNYIGQSLALLRVFESIDRLNKDTSKPILLVGPTGTGKSEIFRIIHAVSDRSNKPTREFRATDAMGTDESVVRTKLVGLGKNSALHGADPKGDPGLLRIAAGGTIFVDEVAEVPDWFQVLLM